MKFKFVEIKGIPVKIIKIGGLWMHKYHFCLCEGKCGMRIPFKEYHKYQSIKNDVN